MESTSDTNAPRPQRRQLSHHSPVERHNQPILVFATLTIQPRGDFLANRSFFDAFRQACADADAWSVGRYMIMPDHVHLFCTPAQWPHVALMRWVRYLKERVTKRLGTASPPSCEDGSGLPDGGRTCGEPGVARAWHWQSDCWDTQIRRGSHYHEKWEYVRQNPVRKALVAKTEDWPWQGELHELRW